MHARRRTHSCTRAHWTFTTWRAPTHPFTHREIYICMSTHTHALYLSEQILASRCGLIFCHVSILHLCILRFCTEVTKLKKTTARASVQTHPGSGACRIANATKPWLLGLFYRQMSKYLPLFLFKAKGKPHGFHRYHSMLNSHSCLYAVIFVIIYSPSCSPKFFFCEPK